MLSSVAGARAAARPTTPWWSLELARRSSCPRSSKRTGMSRARASWTISSTRVSCRPRAIRMRSKGRPASRASRTAWMPVSLSIGETVYRRVIRVESCPGNFCAQRSVEGGAEFQDSLARAFDGDREREGGGFIEKQDHTIEIAPTGAARKRQADRMKEFAAPKAHEVFQYGDDLFESLGGKRHAIEQR